jgi:hypothetical protein
LNRLRRRFSIGAGAAAASLALPACAGRPANSQLVPLAAASFLRAGQRGVGMGLLRFGERPAADLDAAHDIGAGHVRMFIELEASPSQYAFVWPTTQIDALLRNAVQLHARGMYVVPTVIAPTKEADKIWSSPDLQVSLVDFWARLTDRLRGQSVFAAFDLVNEPVPPGFTCGHRQDSRLKLAARVVQAVQKEDAARLCIVESAPNSIPQSFDNLRPLPFQRLVQRVHSYMPMSFTHQGVMAGYSAPKICALTLSDLRTSAAELADSLQPVRNFSERYAVPIYVDELSATRMAPAASATHYIEDSIALFNRHLWSWSHHEFRAWHAWAAEIDSAAPTPIMRIGVAPSGLVLRRALTTARQPVLVE